MTWLLNRHGLEFARISAVDGNDVVLPSPYLDEVAYMRQHGRRPNPFEIGCFLSHVVCARKLITSGGEHALILEDDLEFDNSLLDLLVSALDSERHWDILRLSTVSSGRKFRIHHLALTRRFGTILRARYQMSGFTRAGAGVGNGGGDIVRSCRRLFERRRLLLKAPGEAVGGSTDFLGAACNRLRVSAERPDCVAKVADRNVNPDK